MSRPTPRWRSPGALGLALLVLLRPGSMTGAALALLMGKLLLAAVLVAVALGVSVRLWRGRLPRR